MVRIDARSATRRRRSTLPDARSRSGASTEARVCVFGEYSAAKRAIVADPNDWSKVPRIMKGDPDAVVRQLRSRVIGRTIGGHVAAGVAVAVVAALLASSG